MEGLGLPVELVPRWRSLEYVSTEFSTRIPLLCVLIAEVNQVKDGLLYQCQITEDNCAGCTENYVWVKKAVRGSVSAYVAIRF